MNMDEIPPEETFQKPKKKSAKEGAKKKSKKN